MKKISKDYIEQRYEVAILSYRTAVNEDERHRAMREMAELERTASEMYGFDYADRLGEELRRREIEKKY